METKKDVANINMRNYGILFTICRMSMDSILTKRNIKIDSKQLDAIIVNKLISTATKNKKE